MKQKIHKPMNKFWKNNGAIFSKVVFLQSKLG